MIKFRSLNNDIYTAVLQGLEAGLQRGILCSYPLLGVNVEYSLKQSFIPLNESLDHIKIAALTSIVSAIEMNKSTLYEPIMTLDVTIDNQYMGDILSDINSDIFLINT